MVTSQVTEAERGSAECLIVVTDETDNIKKKLHCQAFVSVHVLILFFFV